MPKETLKQLQEENAALREIIDSEQDYTRRLEADLLRAYHALVPRLLDENRAMKEQYAAEIESRG